MLIGTLPTLTSDSSLSLAEKMVSHPLISAVRYNTGGDSPFKPIDILTRVKQLTDKYGKVLYIDLEGRQLRVAHWTPFEAGSITLNRDFEIVPPARVHIRNAGWFNLVAADSAKRKIYVENGPKFGPGQYYFGESQSVHIVGDSFNVRGYLGGLDSEYIKASIKLGLNHFMLSFVECANDINEFYRFFSGRRGFNQLVVLKIESREGLKFIQKKTLGSNEKLMAARDDLLISFGDNPTGIFKALQMIINADSDAILASRIMHGIQDSGEIAMGDISDLILMSQIGYKNFMFSDGLAKHFGQAIKSWQEILPLLRKEG
ncbi:MAG: hypothetical protein HYX21_00945 [Candidatus Yanofskybacteria bacterium]|nr:hypothetical protein [Candidatus Yanofskybacteria bacterium]